MNYDEKLDTPQSQLAHFGVKGMRWGQRKKYTGTQIKEARANQSARRDRVNRAAQDLNLAKGDKDSKVAAKKYVSAVKDFKTSQDRAVAARATRGEKIAHVLLLGPGALVTLPLNRLHEGSVQRRTDKAREDFKKAGV